MFSDHILLSPSIWCPKLLCHARENILPLTPSSLIVMYHLPTINTSFRRIHTTCKMAEKATASSSKTQPGRTFAQAAATAVASTSLFAQTECVVSLKKHLPKVKLPRPTGLHPVFYDLRSTTASEEAIINILPNDL